MSAKKGLGRSFDSLIPTELLDESFDPTSDQDDKVSDLRIVKLSQITPDTDQPRRHFDDAGLNELAMSIKEHGILQPIVVTPRKGGYTIVAGERRYRASKIAGLEKVPTLVRTLSAQHKLELSLIENLQRRDLNVLETATAYLKLRDQFNLTLEQIGQRVGGKSVSTVSNTLRLLRLPEAVKQAIVSGDLSEGQARPLVNVEPNLIEQILPQIIKQDWSARKIEQYVAELKGRPASTSTRAKTATTESSYYHKTSEKLADNLAMEVRVKATKKGSGQLTIRFKDEKEFEKLKKLLSS